MTKFKLIGAAAVIFASTASSSAAPKNPVHQPSAAGVHSKTDVIDTRIKADSAVEARMAMRKLWEDHIIYTRNYIISALANLADTEAVATRLMRNQDDIGDAIKPYYGEDAGKKLSSLLRDHITIATEVVEAAKADNQSQLKQAQQKWSDNGKDIATFLSRANPNWSKKDLETALQKHLDLTTSEVVGRLGSDWTTDIKAYDDGHAHMLKFSDTLTEGIAKQFPDKFRTAGRM